MNDEHEALVALLRTRPNELTWRKLAHEVLGRGSAGAVWSSYNPDQLIPSPEATTALEEAATDLADWKSSGLRFISVLDDEFPQRLRGLVETPPFVLAQGKIETEDPGVSVVGSRKASPRGLKMATDIATYLVGEGLAVISGLAAGIDAAAHTAALGKGGRTVAFIATGSMGNYPAANRELQAAIADRGLVLSQFWPDAPPQKQNFLKRNALISAYSLAAIVVEAGENSGARNLAQQAVQQGRPLILTDLVAQANNWAQKLAGQPGVFVASDIGDVAALVEEICSQPTQPDAGARPCRSE